MGFLGFLHRKYVFKFANISVFPVVKFHVFHLPISLNIIREANKNVTFDVCKFVLSFSKEIFPGKSEKIEEALVTRLPKESTLGKDSLYSLSPAQL